MAMVTTCPHCSTSFNVAPEVLLSRNGRVRCGHCKQIFDGLMSVTTLEEFQATASAVGGSVPLDATPDAAVSAMPAEIHWPALPEVPDVPAPPMPLEIAAAASPAYLSGDSIQTGAPPPVPAVVPLPAQSMPAFKPRHTEDDEEDIRDEFEAPPQSANRGWVVAAILAALLLAGQVLYRYRSEIAAHFPVAKPVLAQVCTWAGCSVPPLQQPAALNIEASDLQVVDRAQPHLVQLTATLRNRAAIDVGYPAFDLVLTDNREHALARRVIVPADYLPGPASHAALSTIAANAEVTVRVDMDLSGLPAAGFRLNLAFAPSN